MTQKKCETCLGDIYNLWDTECEGCQAMRKAHPELVRWMLNVINQRLSQLTRPLKFDLAMSTEPAKCDTCGRHPSLIVRNARGTFCQEHAVL